MMESRPKAWEQRPVKTVSKVSTCAYSNHLLTESVEKKVLFQPQKVESGRWSSLNEPGSKDKV